MTTRREFVQGCAGSLAVLDTRPEKQETGEGGREEQAQGPEIELLPARPSAWPEGEVLGLCARGGYVVDVAWRDGALLAAKFCAKVAGEVKLRHRDGARSLPLLQGQVISVSANDFFSTRSER